MAHNKSVMKGIVHGRTIELETEPGLPDGQAVSVTIEPVVVLDDAKRQEIFEALKSAAGAWEHDDPEGLEEYLKMESPAAKSESPRDFRMIFSSPVTPCMTTISGSRI